MVGQVEARADARAVEAAACPMSICPTLARPGAPLDVGAVILDAAAWSTPARVGLASAGHVVERAAVGLALVILRKRRRLPRRGGRVSHCYMSHSGPAGRAARRGRARPSAAGS